MFFIDKYLSTFTKILDNLIHHIVIIYCYIVTVLLFILVAYPEQCLCIFCSWSSEAVVELQSSRLDIDINDYMLNLCINNFDPLSLPSDNLYIRFVKFLISEKGCTLPKYNNLYLNSDYGPFTVNNKEIEDKATILNILDLKLKIEQECKLKLEKNYRLKLEEYDLHLAKWLEEGLKEIWQ